MIRAEVVWQRGARSHLDVPKYLGASSAAYHRIHELAQRHTDREIADQLNDAGLPTMKRKPWTPQRVLGFRRSNAIPSGLTANWVLRLPESGYLSSAEVATQLGVEQTRVKKWFQLGVLAGKQNAPISRCGSPGTPRRPGGSMAAPRSMSGWSRSSGCAASSAGRPRESSSGRSSKGTPFAASGATRPTASTSCPAKYMNTALM